MESTKNTKKKFQIGNYVLWFPKGENTHLGKFKKRWFGPFRVQYCLSNNIVILVSINNFEPNLVLFNVNKLKPYKYVDQTLKGIWSLENQTSLESMIQNTWKRNMMKIQKIKEKQRSLVLIKQ